MVIVRSRCTANLCLAALLGYAFVSVTVFHQFPGFGHRLRELHSRRSLRQPDHVAAPVPQLGSLVPPEPAAVVGQPVLLPPQQLPPAPLLQLPPIGETPPQGPPLRASAMAPGGENLSRLSLS